MMKAEQPKAAALSSCSAGHHVAQLKTGEENHKSTNTHRHRHHHHMGIMASTLNERSELHSSSDIKETPPSDEVEITRDDAIKSLLKNDELADLSLRGSDGVAVTANRCLLASRSPVFYRMLFGQFKESSATVIDVNYEGAVLQAIVDYIYTDEIPLMPTPETPWDINFARFVVTVVDAANYFTLPELRRKIELSAKTEMHYKPGLTVPLFLAVCGNTTKVLHDHAMDVVKAYPDILVECSNKVLAMIHPSIVEILMQDPNMSIDTHKRFQILQSWATAGETKDNSVTNDEDSSSRKRSAAEMTNHLRLEDIDIEKLSTTVSSSGLVTEKQISDAYKAQALSYKTQALRVQKKLCTVHEQLRKGHGVWKSTRTTIFEYQSTYLTREMADTLCCPVMKSGVHRWSLRVLRYACGMELGVASARRAIDPNEALSQQRGGWILSYRGTIGRCRITQVDLPRFNDGSTVSFTLNLEGEGVLTASIDNGATFELFSGMISEDDNGFVPALSLRDDDGRVEFLGFEDMS